MMSRKNEKHRGSRTHGRGKKGGRGKGKRGGSGNAGLHKHKWNYTLKYDRDRYGRHGFTRHSSSKDINTINVWALQNNIKTWLENGKAKKKKKGTVMVDLSKLGYDKLLGAGKISTKVEITIEKATEKAIAKIEEAGGKVNIPNIDAES